MRKREGMRLDGEVARPGHFCGWQPGPMGLFPQLLLSPTAPYLEAKGNEKRQSKVNSKGRVPAVSVLQDNPSPGLPFSCVEGQGCEITDQLSPNHVPCGLLSLFKTAFPKVPWKGFGLGLVCSSVLECLPSMCEGLVPSQCLKGK